MSESTLAAHRCAWAAGDALYEAYHDSEWGVPVYDSRELFAKLILDGFQAGLSWRTILYKREAFYAAFDGFDPERIARYNSRSIQRLLGDAGIVRNRAKIEAAIGNARAFLELEQQPGDFSCFIWNFTDGKPICNRFSEMRQIPVQCPQAEALSKALKQRGFKFVGPTIVYAFMQACGLVNDHLLSCPRWKQVQNLRAAR